MAGIELVQLAGGGQHVWGSAVRNDGSERGGHPAPRAGPSCTAILGQRCE